MAKISISFEHHKRGIMVNMTCTDKEDYISTDVIPPDGGCNVKGKLHTKVSFVARDKKEADAIISQKQEAIKNVINKYRASTVPNGKVLTI